MTDDADGKGGADTDRDAKGRFSEVPQPNKFQVMPPLTDDDFAALMADIQANGLLMPVEVDEEGNVLDGHHRLRACRELGIEWRGNGKVREGLTEAEKRRHALTLNIARRHLTGEQRRELVAQQLVDAPERSDSVDREGRRGERQDGRVGAEGDGGAFGNSERRDKRTDKGRPAAAREQAEGQEKAEGGGVSTRRCTRRSRTCRGTPRSCACRRAGRPAVRGGGRERPAVDDRAGCHGRHAARTEARAGVHRPPGRPNNPGPRPLPPLPRGGPKLRRGASGNIRRPRGC